MIGRAEAFAYLQMTYMWASHPGRTQGIGRSNEMSDPTDPPRQPGPPKRRLRLAIVGCGDVSKRHYLPALEQLAGHVELSALVDRRLDAAEALAAQVRAWSPGARAYESIEEAVAEQGGLDAAIDLTPAPAHGAVNRTLLESGLHVYSEKPIASSVPEADDLIRVAQERARLLMGAPGVAVTNRFRWLRGIVDSGRLGRLTLAVGHHADAGPAAWREYTGDPTPFYAEGVGPVFDHGVYRLHGMTTLMGPVKRVQAMGSISVPSRTVLGGPLAGQSIPVTSPDHVMMNMEFANGALGQLLASFGTSNTQAPWLELHFEHGTVSFAGQSHDKDDPADIYFDDDTQAGLEGWVRGLLPPAARDDWAVVEAGVRHFVACLRGDETPVLTAEHARHILDVILRAYDSIEDGASHEVTTTF
jgi:predicted dehydrogenase